MPYLSSTLVISEHLRIKHGKIKRLIENNARIFLDLGDLRKSHDSYDLPANQFKLLCELLTKQRYVYVIQDTHGRVKVGTSTNPVRRVKQLSTGNADALSLVYVAKCVQRGFSDEKVLHKKCKVYHIKNEWYTKEALELIRES